MAQGVGARQTSPVMLAPDDIATSVRIVLESGVYLSAHEILDRMVLRDRLLADCVTHAEAVRRVKEVLLTHLQSELTFDFVPNGISRNVLGSEMPEVTIIFRLRS
jgi:hypothetical protein